MALPGYERIPGSARHYRETESGRELTYDQYLAASRDGMNSHQYHDFRQDGRNLALIGAYKKEHDGKLAGIQLSARNIGLATNSHDKRMALGVFYPAALTAPDDRYPVRARKSA